MEEKPKGKVAVEEEDEDQDDDDGAQLGNGGVILVLFETPTGFALFSYDGIKLLRPHALMHPVWLKEFQAFEDKASALSLDTGVSEQLAGMIRRFICPGQTLAVGKQEYVTIIQSNLGIKCLWNAEVMELMWGLNNLKEHLVPDGKSDLSKEDCLPMCEGMKFTLNKYGFGDLKPEMVTRSIIEATGLLYETDYHVRKHGESMRYAGKHLKKISGINAEDWDLLKLATAIMMLCYPNGEYKLVGNLPELFGDDYSKLVDDAPKYKGIFRKLSCLRAYAEMVRSRRIRSKAARRLDSLVTAAERIYDEAQQAQPGVIKQE
uniref:Nucleolar protein 58/56 N-terminal domain-containing protein n=1 Tax=Oryza glaberrima TaxID=4538 RepID=I1QF07_ORYGL